MDRKEAPNLFAKSVGTGLRGLMYRRIVLWTLLCGGIAATCVYGAAEMLFTRVYAFSRESNEREAENRLRLFDTMIARSERDSLENGRRALAELARLHAKTARWASSGAARASQAGLAREAAALGISEIYLVDPDGIVAATSFAPDLRLDLFSLGPDFVSFLRSVYGSGEAFDQTLSGSTMTGTINSYQYYSPKGGDYIIEISTRLDDAIGRSYPGLDYAGLVALAFGASADSSSGSSPIPDLERIVDLIAVRGISHWSLFQRRVDESRYSSLVAHAMLGESAWAREGGFQLQVRPIPLSEGSVGRGDTTYYAVFEIDERPLVEFRLFALLSALASCCLATGLSFTAMKQSFDRNVATRIERLREGIARAAQGRYDLEGIDLGSDEIGEIGQSISAMVRTILEKEERLRTAQRMETIGAMAGGLAHDFSNILTGISGTIECLEIRLASGDVRNEDMLELTALAQRTARRGGDLVRALIDIAPTRPPERHPADLTAIAREAAELATGSARELVEVKFDTAEDSIMVECDARAVLRAALNLCINGIHAMTEMRRDGERRGGALLVRAESRRGRAGKPDEAAIVVHDEGVGIAPEEIGKILAPFYSTKPRGLGTGIGLAIASSVAEVHDGRLEIESELGVGSTFALVLPL
jgi:signal transduction histidine kinase